MLKRTKSLYVNEGTSGCVYRPPVPCINPIQDIQLKDKLVGKIFRLHASAKDEWDEAMGLKKIDPGKEFTMQPRGKCKVHTNDIDFKENECDDMQGTTFTQIIYPDGGEDLESLVHKNIIIKFSDLIEPLSNVINGIKILQSHDYIHADIKPLNIVYDVNGVQKAFLIDFGLSMKFPLLYNLRHNQGLRMHPYSYFPPEMRAFYVFEESGLTLDFLESIRLAAQAAVKSFVANMNEPMSSEIKFIFKKVATSVKRIYSDCFEPLRRIMDTNKEAAFLFKSLKSVNIWDKDGQQNYMIFCSKMFTSPIQDICAVSVTKLDIYSFGVTVFELLVKIIRKHGASGLSRARLGLVSNFIKGCITFDVDARSSVDQAISDWNLVLTKNKKTKKNNKQKTIKEYKPCKPDQVRNPLTHRCNKLRANGAAKVKASDCHAGFEPHPKTGRCIKVCLPNKIRNIVTMRCNNIKIK